MHEYRGNELRGALALFISLLIVGLGAILSVNRNPDTGQVSLNVMVLFLGILVALLFYIALTFQGFRRSPFIRIRFCVSCGRSIPFDAVICPYCRYDYEKK